MGNTFKRILAMVLALTMVLAYVPFNTFATETETGTETQTEGTTQESQPVADGEPDAQAETEGSADETGSIVYEIIEGTYTAKVADGKTVSGDVVIPETVTIDGVEYTVVEIAGNAFNDANEVTSIEVPNTVTTLGGAAFANMDKLKTLKIGNGVTSWGSKLAVNNYELETVVIAEGATLIGDLAFRTCPKLANLTLPSTLKSIGATAFAYAAITELTIPASVESIGADSFKDIDTLKKVTFLGENTKLGSTSFQMCDGLEEVVLPAKLTVIPQGAFRYCTALKIIEFPETLTEIGNYSFQGCTSLESVTISKNITNLVTNAFNGCTSLKNLTIEEGFAGTIGGYVFQGCTALESVVIPSSMETVGESMFNMCSNLKNVTLSEGVKTLNISAFANCTSLETLVLPDSLERMRHGSIANCTGLKTLVITGENLPVIEHSNALDGLSEELVVYYTGDDEFTGNWAALANNVVNEMPKNYVAQVGETKYESLQDAVEAAQTGETVVLLDNITLTDDDMVNTEDNRNVMINVTDKSIILNLNEKTITVDYNGGQYLFAAVYVADGAGLTVTGNGGIDIPENGKNVAYMFWKRGTTGTLVVENGTYHMDNSADSMVYTNGNEIVTIKGGTWTLDAWDYENCPWIFNVQGAGDNHVIVTGGTFNSNVQRQKWANEVMVPTTHYVEANADGTWTVKSGATLYAIEGILTGPYDVPGWSIGYPNLEAYIAAANADEDDTTEVGEDSLVLINDPSTYKAEGYKLVDNEDGTWTVVEFAAVAEVDGTQYESLTEAVAAANAIEGGATVTLLSDVVLDAPLVITGTVVLELAGKTVTYTSTTQGEAMITNKGTLTINDSSDPDSGVINYNYTGAADSTYSKGNYTISNGGTLTVNGGKITIANLRAHAKYPIDNNSTSGDAVLVINGGHLYNYNTSAIRQFCNSTTNKNSVTINGGLIEGYSAIWMQNPGKNTVNGSLTITGGEIRTTAAAYVNGTSALKDVSSDLYCTIDGEGGAWSKDSAVSITGGTFNENVYLAEEAPAAITIGEGAIFNGRLELPAVPVAEVNGTQYETLAEAVAAANAIEGGATVTLLADVALDEMLTISGNVTIEGAYTITWADGYTGTLINVDSGASVKLKNLTIDGENAFTFYDDTTTVENGQNWYTRFVNVGEEDKAVNADVIVNAGNLTLMGVTIKNVTIASDNANGKTENTETGYVLKYNDDLAIIKSNGGSVVITNNGSSTKNTKISGNAGLVLNAINANTQIIGNSVIEKNMGCGNKGGIIIANGGTMEISGASGIVVNKAMARSATILGVINGAEVTFGGLVDYGGDELYDDGTSMSYNKHIGVGSNTAGAMIVLEGASRFVMNGGTIWDNAGGRAGAIASRWVGGSYGQHEETSIVLNAGSIKRNTASNDSWNGASIFLRSPATIGEGMTIDGTIAVNAAPGALEITGGTFNGELIVTDGLTAEITGGTFNYDPSVYVAEGYIAEEKTEGYFTVREANYVAQVGETKYETVQEAVDAAKNGGTVELIANVSSDTKNVVVLTEGYDVTIDLCGFTMEAVERTINVKPGSKLTIKDSSEAQTGMVKCTIGGTNNTANVIQVQYGATFILESGTLHSESNAIYAGSTYNENRPNIVINGGKTEAENGAAIYVMIGSVITVNGGELNGAAGIRLFTNTVGASTITVTGGSVMAEQTAAVVIPDVLENTVASITGGTFSSDVNEYCAKGYKAEDNGDGTWTVVPTKLVKVEVEMMTGIWGTSYITVENWADLEAALGANTNLPVKVTLLADVELTKFLTITGDKTVELNLNGYNITREGGTALYINGENTTVNITGEGTVSGQQAVYVNAGKVTINGGAFHGASEAVYVINNGHAEIYGGTFSSDNVNFVLNEYDKTRDATTITVYGGTFVGFNPENNAAEGAGTNFVADGYAAIYDEAQNTYTVVDYIKWIKAELLAGNDVTLDRDIVLDDISYVTSEIALSNGNGAYLGFDYGNGAFFNVIGGDVTFDLNGHSITYDIHDEAWCGKRVVSIFYATDKANLTVIDSVGTGAVTVNGMATAVYSVAAGTQVTISGGTWTWNPCETCGATNVFLYASHGGELYITDGTFTNNVEGASAEYMIMAHYSSKETTENWAGVDYDSTKIEISGGTFAGYNPEQIKYMDNGNSNAEKMDNAVAKGYKAEDNGDGTWTVVPTKLVKVEVEMMTGIWGTSYITVENWADLEAALGANTNLPVKVTLLADVELTKFLTITGDKTVELNLNGYNITREGGTALYINGENTTVNITGEGTVSGQQAVYVNAGKVTINGGAFHGASEAVYVINNGHAEIYGGTFSSDNVNFVLNEYDKTRDVTTITVYGGTFVGFNPEDNAAEGTNTNFVAEGYKAVDNGDDTWSVVEKKLFDIVSINIKAGESLDMYFYVQKADLDGTDYYAVVTKTFADGRENVVKTIPYSEWESYNSTLFRFGFDDISAKEMTDEIYVTVYNGDGTPASNERVESIKSYAELAFEKVNDEMLWTALIDMLNYGAAAQDFFDDYNIDDLANAGMEEYQQYATQSTVYENKQEKGDNFVTATVSAKNKLMLTFYFNNITTDMTAYVSYTDHYGNAESIEIAGSEFVARGNMYGVDVTGLAIADGRQLVTCVIKDSNGNEIAKGVDSVESYCARAAEANLGDVFILLMKFVDSAYNYFHN